MFHSYKRNDTARIYMIDTSSSTTPLQRLLVALVGVQVAAWIGCAVFLGTLV
ncbi:MAG: hypothetical protein OXC68_04330 [Aestuariivita sp.]|nr:hypothetical protein [Aestuariivita sp.]